MAKYNNAIGILGGSFDPPHAGHLKISEISLKKLNLKKVYWIVAKKNPFKKGHFFSLKERIKRSVSITKKNRRIHVKYLDNKVNSSRTIKIIKHFKKNKKISIYLIIGSDNLIWFHKWLGWKKILQICELIVFSRKGFDKKARKSATFRYLKKKNIIFIKNQKIDISSTELRRYYKKKYI